MKTALLAALTTLMIAAPAHADDGAWKVGSSYVIRFEQLDLNRPADRATLLAQVERSSEKLCAGESPRSARKTCQAVATANAVGMLQPFVRKAVETARLERDVQQQAQR